MGAVVSSTNDGDYCGIVADLTHPSNEDWLRKHAVACNVSIGEIESLWKRFQDLGCNENGVLSPEILTTSNLNKDHTMKTKILEMMPRSKENELTFQTFCNMSRWMADASVEAKVRVVFQCLNNNQPLDLHVLMDLLSEIYCDESKEVIERSAKVFLHQVGDMLTHSIDEEHFVKWAMELPKDTVQALMDFTCPADDTPKLGSNNELPRTKDLLVVARMASRKDWILLANKLGFTQADINSVKKKLPDQDKEQIERMLSLWRQKQDEQATLAVLLEALRSSGMEDIAQNLEINNA
ncbi:uncharacterized protein LOC117298570 [Asterias rubens]|uniref:uncharacterized protein LOC117298570 n=1 Tax=Asterias rubens TaxID=7604 RepID=UPI001454FE08|nr:uncharacterized protein LOC117298570 [Asterias rubens]XP_033637780.1 uncharacterized protein LOC117298570 [Asterias rubens]